MHQKAATPLAREIASDFKIWLISFLAGFCVLALAILFQWLIYDDWLHDSGPLRVVGSFIAGIIMFASAWRWQLIHRRRKLEMLQRFETIKWMTDRIRNSLQAIECITFAASPEATEPVREAVNAIEAVLHEVLAEHHPATLQSSSSTTREVEQS
jgi:Flp pilus assembly protein TadB